MTIMSSEVSERARSHAAFMANLSQSEFALIAMGDDGETLLNRTVGILHDLIEAVDQAALSSPPSPIDDEVTQADRDAAKPFFNEGGPAYPELVQAFRRHRIAAAGEVRRRTIEECAAICEGFDDFDYVQLPVGHDRWEPGSPYDRGAEAAAKKLAQAIRSLSAKEEDNA